MRIAAAALALLSFDLYGAEGDRTLALPRALHPGEIAVIEVQVGTLARGQEIHVATQAGRELGVISTYGVKSGQVAGTYPVPVPRDAIADTQLIVRLSITTSGAQPRAPTEKEITKVGIVIGGSAADTAKKKGENQ